MAKSLRVGSSSVVGAMCDAIKLVETIDSCVSWDERQCKLSPGTKIKAMIINILSGRSPLYTVHKYYEKMDVASLFGQDVNSSDFKDHNLARALDKLNEAGAKKVFSSVALNAVSHEDVSISTLHGDTTSWTLTGIYDEDDESSTKKFNITKGYNKDHRPGSNQFIYGLVVTEDRIPIIGDVKDGNTSDKAWNGDVLDELSKLMTLKNLENLTYVADSAFVTEQNITKAKDFKFISRLPGTYSLEQELKEKAWESNKWEDIGVIAATAKKDSAVYRYQDFVSPLYGDDYRFVVVHSSKLDTRKLKTLEKNIAKLKDEIDKAVSKIKSESFACIPDALASLKKFQKQYKNDFFTIEGESVSIEEPVKRNGKGRPKKDSIKEYSTVYRLNIKTSELNKDAFQREKERLSCFVLITNIMDASKTGADILTEYKNQSSIELQFKTIKDPKFVGAMYLKRPQRVEALAYVVLMAVLIKNLLERRVRKALKSEKEPLILPGNKKTFEPTGDKILEIFSDIDIIVFSPSHKELSETLFPTRLFKLASLEPEIYLRC
jgi:transposase